MTGRALVGAHGREMELSQARGEYPHVDRIPWILSHVPDGAKVLELGCGTGWAITLPLLRQGIDVVGVDIDEPSIRMVRRCFGVRDSRRTASSLGTCARWKNSSTL